MATFLDCPEAVSYTHLDVYKRQPLGKAVVRCYRKGETRELPQPEQFRMIPGRGVQAVRDGLEHGDPEQTIARFTKAVERFRCV